MRPSRLNRRNAGEVVWQVQWCERDQPFESSLEFGRHEFGTVTVGPSVDDSVANRDDCPASTTLLDRRQYEFLIGDAPRFVHPDASCLVNCTEAALVVADGLNRVGKMARRTSVG